MNSHYFSWRRAPDIGKVQRIVLLALCGAGFLSVIRLADWWFRREHVASVPLFVLLSIAFWYSIARMLIGWINVAALRVAPARPAARDLRVAIFTTSSPGEPLAMFETTLEACARITYPHTTYLLDDTRDKRFRQVAERNGAVWLELVGLPGAKAGKINAALGLTDEPFILVLDPDHIPFPNFLDRVLGHFEDPRMGFVQVAQAYYNQDRSFVARGAAEQTYAFYGPTQLGLSGHGCAVAIGANCTFRRAALESIGGHGIGLAEDLVTSIRLHAAGWKSVYVPEIVSRGLVPEDLGSFYKQQLKWARGVYEVAFTELPAAMRTLTWRQRLSYATIGTYYLSGITTPMYLVFPYIYLMTGSKPASMLFEQFVVVAGLPAMIGLLLYLFTQRWLSDRVTESGLHVRGMMLKLASWPVFFAGTLYAILRLNIPYVPTAKEAVRGRFFRLAWPHLTLLAGYCAALMVTIYRRLFVVSEGRLMLSSQAVWAMLGFATFAVLLASGGIHAAWQARTPPRTVPWDDVNVKEIDAT